MNKQYLKGSGWAAIRTNSTYIVSIDHQADITSTIEQFLKQENIRTGKISGIGAVDKVILKFFELATKEYDEKVFEGQMELVSLLGNISMIENHPTVHLHATLGKSDYTAISGHFETGTVSGACELIIESYPLVLQKKMDDALGIQLYHFD